VAPRDPVANTVLELLGSDPGIGRHELAQRVRERTGVPLGAAITRIRTLEREGALGAGAEPVHPTGRASSSPVRQVATRAAVGRNRSVERSAPPSPGGAVGPTAGKESARANAGLGSQRGEEGTVPDDRSRREDSLSGQLEENGPSQANDGRGSTEPRNPERLRHKTAEMRAAVTDLRSQMEELRLSLEHGHGTSQPPEG